MKSKVNFSTLVYMEIGHLENRTKSFLPKIMQIRKTFNCYISANT